MNIEDVEGIRPTQAAKVTSAGGWIAQAKDLPNVVEH